MTRSRPPRIVLQGYYGFGNAGDESLLRAVLADLRRLRPEADITVLSADPAATSRQHHVKAVARFHPTRVWRTLRRADLLVLGGGTLLQDATSLRSLAYYAATVLLAHRFGARVMLYANGLGPIRSGMGRRLARAALAAAHTITLRDQDSLQLLRALTGGDVPAEVTADAALGLPSPLAPAGADDDPVRAGLRPLGLEPGQYVVVCLRPWGDVVQRLDDLALLSRSLTGQADLPTVFLPLHEGHDRALAEALAARAGANAQVVTVDPCDTNALLAVLGQARAVLAMRLHALILAAVAGQAALAISYDPKVDAIARQLGLPVLASADDLPPLTTLVARLETALAELPARTAALRRDLPGLRDQARRNAELAVSLLPR